MKAYSFLNNIAIRFLYTLPLRFKGLIVLPFLTRAYSSEIYGAWLQIFIINELLKYLLSFNFGAAIVRYLSGDDDSKKTIRSVFTVTATLSAIFFFAVFFSKKIICLFIFGKEDFEKVLIISSIWVIIQAHINICHCVLRSQERIGTLSTRELLSACWLVFSVTFAFFFGLSIEKLLICCIIGDLALLVWILIQIGVPFPFTSLKNAFIVAKRFFPFSYPLALSSLLLWSTRSIDRFLIVQTLGLSEVGIYGVAFQIASVILIFLKPINFVLFPKTSSAWNSQNMLMVSSYFSQAVMLTIVLSLPILVGIFSTSNGIISLIAGPRYFSSSILVLYLLMACTASMIYQNHLFVIQLKEKTIYLPLIFLAAAFVNFFMGYILIKIYGLQGVAFSRFFTMTLMAVIITIWARKYVKFELNWPIIFKVTVASLIMGAIIQLLPMRSAGTIAIKIITGFIIFLISLYYLKVLNRENILSIKKQLLS
jgi:O-antigen/teichoic acid export membrane protein